MLGGYKPLEMRHVARGVYDRFVDPFVSSFYLAEPERQIPQVRPDGLREGRVEEIGAMLLEGRGHGGEQGGSTERRKRLR